MRPSAFDAAIAAARAGAVPELVGLLRAHATLPYHVADDGRTLLTAAAERGHADAVRAVLLCGVPGDLEDAAGATALSLAIAHRRGDVALALAEQDPVDGDALRSLGFALDDAELPPVDPDLLARRTSLAALRERRAALATAIAADDLGAVDAVDAVVLAVPDAGGRTAVTQAIAERRIAVLEQLLNRMDAPHGADDAGLDPLAHAEATGDAELVALVLDASPLVAPAEAARLRARFPTAPKAGSGPRPPAVATGFDVDALEATALAGLSALGGGRLVRLLVDASTVYAVVDGAPAPVAIAELAAGFDDDLYQDHLDADDAARAVSPYRRAMAELLARLGDSEAARSRAGGAPVDGEVLEHVE